MKLLIVLVLVAALAVGGVLLARHESESPEWTTDSPAAAAAFEEAIAARQKLYGSEALAHLEQALALDPDFVMPHLELIQLRRLGVVDRERVGELVEELKQVDLDRLNPRERLLVRYYLAEIDRDRERAAALLEEYLAERPDDPYAVALKCQRLWGAEEAGEAEACYRRLIELEPNWVEAQNHLGYLAMGRGDFADAEEQFEIYRYIAPDQANPHDSLGELLLVVGRWEEAEAEFRRALELRPDFCASWLHLADLSLLEGDPAEAAEIVADARQAGGCPSAELTMFECKVGVMRGVAESWQAAYEAARACDELYGQSEVFAMRAAVATGHTELADELQAKHEKRAAEYGGHSPMLDHLVGARRLQEGDPAAAVERFRAADAHLRYFGAGDAVFKLYNRLLLADALAAAGRPEEAAALRAEVREVNPLLADLAPPAAVASGSAAAGAGGSREAPSAP